jgi:DMSO/TMAO reductase YedYZ molybdopterin-dependent catalytic subunit
MRWTHGRGGTGAIDMSRRSLIDWLGKATVLALGGEVLAACAGPAVRREAGPDADLEAGPDDAWAFRPPAEAPGIYDDWPVRTVDRQQLEAILASWRLTIDGMVETPRTLTFAELLGLERQDQLTDFHCVEGWSVLDVPWNGVHLGTLLALVGPRDAATHVTFHTIDSRYNESLPREVALEPHTLLAYGVAEHTLPLDHGFPLRLVVPRLFAYKSAKYVDRIELTDEPVEGYWVRGGYDYMGEVPESRLRSGRT